MAVEGGMGVVCCGWGRAELRLARVKQALGMAGERLAAEQV